MSLDDLSEAFKAANITQDGGEGTLDENPMNEGGKGTLDENPMNPHQVGESMVGISPDQKVKIRKNSEGGKRVKKRKLEEWVHSLRSIGEDNEQIMSQNDFMIQDLRLKRVEIEKQKAEFCVSQHKTITAQANFVETLWQEPFVQHLMVGSNQLEVAAQCAVSSPNADWDGRMPSEGKQSLDGIIELKHRQMVLNKKVELLCKAIINEKP